MSPTKPLRIPPEDPDKVRTRDRADIDRDFPTPPRPGGDEAETDYVGPADDEWA